MTPVRVAAVGDVHFGLDSAGRLRPHLQALAEQADVLLLAGDLTKCGHPDEARVLAAELRIALMHYSPIESTLSGERLGIYPFLGSYFLAEAVDRAGADLVIHGHAHSGSEKGVTPGGVPVRNVALPVIKHAYNVYELG